MSGLNPEGYSAADLVIEINELVQIWKHLNLDESKDKIASEYRILVLQLLALNPNFWLEVYQELPDEYMPDEYLDRGYFR